VNAEAIFLSEISKLKRRVFSRFVYRILLWGSAFFLGGFTILSVIAKAGLLGSMPYEPWLFIMSAISLIAAIVVALFEKKDFRSFLIDIDLRLQLRDSISTAFEYQRSANTSAFLDLLMQDATAKLRRLKSRQIFPAKFPGLYFALILVLITTGALFLRYYSELEFTPVPADQKKIEKARTMVRDFVRSHVAVKRSEEARDNSIIAGNVRKLRKTLNDPAITQDQLFDSLNRHLKEIQAEQARLAADLAARINDVRIMNMPVQDFSDPEKLNASQLIKLKQILNQALNNRIPDGIQHDMESLQELLNMEKFLSQIIDGFHESNSDPEAFAETRRNQSSGSSSPRDFREKGSHPDHPATGGDIQGEEGSREADIPGRPRLDSSQADGIDVPDASGLSHGTSPRAGTAKSDGKEKPGSDIEKVPGPGIQDKVMSAQIRHYLMRIRSQTETGESRLKEAEIVREYQQEVEGVLQKEEIPLNYREYIKNYFLSIGIETSDSLK
jgi:hypothetical protein